jgi:hypothetical protein
MAQNLPYDRPMDLVALRDRREQVIQLLADGFANDLVDLAEFERRTGLAHQATNVADLDALVADLVPDLARSVASKALVKLETDPLVESQRPERRRQLIVFGNVERHGGWIVPREQLTTSIFSSAVLDFREARLAPGVTILRVSAVFGNVEIIVPPQLAVESSGSAVFGNFEEYGGAVADPDRPILRIEGSAIFGNVEISVRLPGESERDARKRHAVRALLPR